MPCSFCPTTWAAPLLFSGRGADTVTVPSPSHSTSTVSLPGGPPSLLGGAAAAAAAKSPVAAIALELSATSNQGRIVILLIVHVSFPFWDCDDSLPSYPARSRPNRRATTAQHLAVAVVLGQRAREPTRLVAGSS